VRAHAALETGRLSLRPFRMQDVDALHALWTDPGVRRFLWDDEVITRDQAEQAVRAAVDEAGERGFGLWTLHRRDEAGVIGFCGFRTLEQGRDVELLYGVHPDFWGRGLAVEASHVALERLFAEHPFDRVWALADPPNAQSFRVMEKLGMRFDRDGEYGGLPARFYVLDRP